MLKKKVKYHNLNNFRQKKRYRVPVWNGPFTENAFEMDR